MELIFSGETMFSVQHIELHPEGVKKGINITTHNVLKCGYTLCV